MLFTLQVVSEGADYFLRVSSFSLNGSCFRLEIGVSMGPSSFCSELSGPFLEYFLGSFWTTTSHIGGRMEAISKNVDGALELEGFQLEF